MIAPRLLSLLALSALSTSARAQGSLTPPAGVPTASMRTLDQVEARTPLVAGAAGVAVSAAGTITISQSGSYYLTKNITITTNVSGLVINADATVDLNGFSIIGTAAAITTAPAVSMGDFQIVLGNGIIKGGTAVENFETPSALGGFLHGVQAAATSARNARLHDLTVTGMRDTGILVPRVALVERCQVSSCGGSGIQLGAAYGTVADSMVSNCAGTTGATSWGIRAHTVRNCTAAILAGPNADNGQPCGINAVRVENSTGYADTGYGGVGEVPTGIKAKIASYCTGKGSYGIETDVAIACLGEGGFIASPSKHLGTP